MNEPKLDLTRPVQTRDGRAVRILCTDAKSPQSVIGLVADPDGKEHNTSWQANGLWGYGDSHSSSDLINVPIKHKLEGWVNVYSDNLQPTYFHSCKAMAGYSGNHLPTEA